MECESNFERVYKSFCIAMIVAFSVLFLVSFALLMAVGWFIVLPILFGLGCVGLIAYGQMKVKKDEVLCVMCDEPLAKEDESQYWAGSHEWCDDCY